MDLGCLDLGCISVLDKHSNDAVLYSGNKDCDSTEKFNSGSKPGKNKSPKGAGQSALNALNKFTSQIKKPSHRKNSPINWFPRRKGDSYLQKKIKMLQEVDGMNMTLDQALGDSNPHYSKVLREKIAAREVADKAVEARKAALVEASWCRILKAARIQSKEAEELLLKAERTAAEAFEAAKAMEVIMFDITASSQMPCQGPISTGEHSTTTHTVSASFATVFEVDKQVTAAVKTAFIRLAKCPSFNKEEFKDILHKISENPDMGDSVPEFSDCESEYGPEFEPITEIDGSSSQDMECKLPFPGKRLGKYKTRQSLDKLNMAKLVDMMLERLRCLNEDELSPLATIVATCGLNAALAEVESSKLHDSDSAADYTTSQGLNHPKIMSSVGSGMVSKNKVQLELPSLDKFLVKHTTKLEREVQEAKDRRRNESKEGNPCYTDNIDDGKVNLDGKKSPSESIPDLGSLLVKHHSKFEKEIEEAKKNSRKSFEIISKKTVSDLATSGADSDLGSILIKHRSKLEKEVMETRKNSGKTFDMDGNELGGAPNRAVSRIKDVPEIPSPDKHLVKHMPGIKVQEARNRNSNSVEEGRSACMKHEGPSSTSSPEPGKTSSSDQERVVKENLDLDKEENKKQPALSMGSKYENQRHQNKHGGNAVADCEGLDKVLVKHVSRLEKEKMTPSLNTEDMNLKRGGRKSHSQMNEGGGGGLDQILVKHKSRLEREKMASAQHLGEVQAARTVSRREARERELQEAWGGLSLENSIGPHLSKSGLDQILVKHKSRLEREKMASSAQQLEEVPARLSVSRREARERELQEAWGGLSLGNSIQPHLSKLERDKAAWIKAEEEARRRAMKEV